MDNVSLVLLVEEKLPVRIHHFYNLLAIICQHVYKIWDSLRYIINNHELTAISIATILFIFLEIYQFSSLITPATTASSLPPIPGQQHSSLQTPFLIL